MKRGTKVMAMVAVAFFALAGQALAGGTSKQQVTGVVNLNTATQKQLEALPGVGEKSAAAIIMYRLKTPFAKVDDLVKVKGIGPKKLEALRPYLTLTGASTIAVHKPSKRKAQGSSTAQGRKATPRP